MIVFSALFSGIETGLLVLKRHQTALDNEKFSHIKKLLNKIEELMVLILVGNNLMIVGASSIMSSLFIKLYGTAGIVYGSIAETLLFLIFGEVLPKNAFLRHPVKYISKFLWFIKGFSIALYPFAYIFLKIKKILVKDEDILYSAKENEEGIDVIEDIAKAITSWEPETPEHKEIKTLISELLELRTLRANQVMIPTFFVQSVDKKSKIEDVIQLIYKTKFSYIPIYDGRVDNIVGYIYARDLLLEKNIKKKRSVMDYKRDAYFVPENKIVYEILEEMRERGIYIVFVVNEVGATTGIITIDDIVEEVIGEIRKKLSHLLKEEVITEIEAGKVYRVRGDTDIEFIKETLKVDIPRGPYETISGYIYHIYKGIPKQGEEIITKDMKIKVVQANPKGIKSIIITLINQKEKEEKK
jgi:CBS domain containing-hemolysin-like protein